MTVPFKVLTAGQVLDAGAGSRAADWKRNPSQDVIEVEAGDLIAPYLDQLSADLKPLAVVRENGTVAGLVTGNSLLQALAANISVPSKKPKPIAAADTPSVKGMADAMQRAV